MGRVYLARHVALQGQVVVKLLDPAQAIRPELADRMRLEGQTLAQLTQRNVVRVLDAGQTASGRPYLVMERLTGQTVAEQLKHRPETPLAECLDWMAQMLTGLAAAHAAGIVHRDVKPSNLFLCDPVPGDGEPNRSILKLIDFGIAKVLPRSSRSPRIRPLAYPNATGRVVGTPSALSPEQIRGDAVDSRADLFAAGLVFFRLLVGRSPYGTTAALHRAYRERDALPDSAIPAELPPAVRQVLARALRFAPHERYQSAGEFLTAVQELGPPEPGQPSRAPSAPPVIELGDAAMTAAHAASGSVWSSVIFGGRTGDAALIEAARPWRVALVLGAAVVLLLMLLVAFLHR
jgi:serine/threonine-protein kinase